MHKLKARWHSWCRRRAALSYKLNITMHALLKVLPTKRMLPMHIVEPFGTNKAADEIRTDDASMLQGLATVGASHHVTALTGGGPKCGVQHNESCMSPPRPSKEVKSDR